MAEGADGDAGASTATNTHSLAIEAITQALAAPGGEAVERLLGQLGGVATELLGIAHDIERLRILTEQLDAFKAAGPAR